MVKEEDIKKGTSLTHFCFKQVSCFLEYYAHFSYSIYINMVCWDIFYPILLKHIVLTMIHILDTTGIKT